MKFQKRNKPAVVRQEKICPDCQTGVLYLATVGGQLRRLCPCCGYQAVAPVDAQLRASGAPTLPGLEVRQ